MPCTLCKMEETGLVVDVKGGIAKVEFFKKPLCKKCGLCRNTENNKMYLEIENTLGAKPGDEVVFEIMPSSAGISALIYGIPSVFLILGVLLGISLFHSEIYGFILGLVFLIVSFILTKFCNKLFPGIFLPKMKKIIKAGEK